LAGVAGGLARGLSASFKLRLVRLRNNRQDAGTEEEVINFLVRCLFFILGCGLLLDVALPMRNESLSVDAHTTRTEHRSDDHFHDTDYEVHFIGGKTRSCSVGYEAYGKLHDGDRVEVRSTRLINACRGIVRDGETILRYASGWWIVHLLAAGLLLAAAFGRLPIGEDNGVSIRL
jgi:hypothetical protein